MTSIEPTVFNQVRNNPEEFILKAASLINDEKAEAIIQHIEYNALNEQYSTDIFTDTTIRGKLGANAMKTRRHLYDHLVYDSDNEHKFASMLDIDDNVAETKGSMQSMQLRGIEQAKKHCAEEHFKKISSGNVIYEVVDSYQALLDIVRK